MSPKLSDAEIDSLLEAGQRPTLKTISQATGLAVATVSRALNDAPDIGKDTKQRVHDVARRLGYRPNRAGVRLRTGRTNVISLVLATDHDVMNHTARLLSSIVATLRGTQYHMIVTPYFPDEDPMIPVRYLVESGSADAIIMNQIRPRDARVAYLMEKGIPFATHGRSDWRDRHAWYDFDNARFAEIGVRTMAARGRRNLAAVLPPAEQNYAQDLRSGIRTASAALNDLQVTILPGVNSDGPAAEIEAGLAAMLAADPSIDGILCASTTSAMSATSALEAAGRTVGEDIDIFAKEAIPFLKRFRRGILTVHEDVARCGTFLAHAAIARINDPDGLPMQELERPEFDPG